MSALGSIAIAVGLTCAWIDIGMNGARYAESAGLMLSLATVGMIMVGADYYGGQP